MTAWKPGYRAYGREIRVDAFRGWERQDDSGAESRGGRLLPPAARLQVHADELLVEGRRVALRERKDGEAGLWRDAR